MQISNNNICALCDMQTLQDNINKEGIILVTGISSYDRDNALTDIDCFFYTISRGVSARIKKRIDVLKEYTTVFVIKSKLINTRILPITLKENECIALVYYKSKYDYDLSFKLFNCLEKAAKYIEYLFMSNTDYTMDNIIGIIGKKIYSSIILNNKIYVK